MTRKMLAFAIGMLLLCAGFCIACAEEEGKTPATPTDLSCLHEHTKTTIYFYDSPAYSALNANSHRVSGPAAVETVCEDCGAQLSYETVSYVEEVRPHTMKKGVCVLCGYRDITAKAEEQPITDPDEWMITAREDGDADGLLSVTLTVADLYELEKSNVPVALVKGKTGEAMVVLDVTEVLRQTEATGAALQVRIAEREDDSFFAGVFLVSDSGAAEPAGPGITLRFYRKTKADVRISLVPFGKETLIELESVWDEKGYWSVPYTEEGTYFVLQ